MTYRDLLRKLNALDANRLDDTATVFLKKQNEYIAVESVKATGEVDGVLDEGHTIIIVNF